MQTLEMQALDVISVNLWQIVISLLNLTLLFFILKHFLYKPVKNALAKRQAALAAQYDDAAQAQAEADANKAAWNEKMALADQQVDDILKDAAVTAGKRSDAIIADARDKAGNIIRQAENEAIMERQKAAEGMKREIVDVSAKLTEKMLSREINEDDHRELIDSFLTEIGDGQ